ncbi:MAG: hypothetical protein AAFX94_00110 [Myxococcota bacterium]
MTKSVAVEVGWEVFAADGDVAFGAVREIHADHLVVFVEGLHDVNIDAGSVKDVHYEKVIVDVASLDDTVREAIGHAHDGETYDPDADEPEIGD